ncbi:MAG: hypothetical protein ACLP7W_01015 [Solirubrobacteraceae bacterium]|jgi:hypothetical protein
MRSARRPPEGARRGNGEPVIELRALAAVSALDRARGRVVARRPRLLGSPPVLAAATGAALGWVVRGMILRDTG